MKTLKKKPTKPTKPTKAQKEVKNETTKAMVSIKILGRVFKSEGLTLEEAIKKIKISGGVRSLSVLTVEQGDRKRTKILSGSVTNQLFGHVSNTAKIIGLKHVKQIFP